jgi:hypothetical protein
VEGGNFIPPFVRKRLLKGHLLSDPLSYLLWLSKQKKKGKLWPPPTSGVKEKLIKFSKEQIKLSFVASSCKVFHHDMRHPTLEGRWWCCILTVMFKFGKGEILQTHNRFGKSTHELSAKVSGFAK